MRTLLSAHAIVRSPVSAFLVAASLLQIGCEAKQQLQGEIVGRTDSPTGQNRVFIVHMLTSPNGDGLTQLYLDEPQRGQVMANVGGKQTVAALNLYWEGDKKLVLRTDCSNVVIVPMPWRVKVTCSNSVS